MAAFLIGGINPLIYYTSVVNDGRPNDACECLDDSNDMDLEKEWMDYQDKQRDLEI